MYLVRSYFSGMSDGWMDGLNGNIANSVHNWIRIGIGLSLAIFVFKAHMAKNSKNKLGKQ